LSCNDSIKQVLTAKVLFECTSGRAWHRSYSRTVVEGGA